MPPLGRQAGRGELLRAMIGPNLRAASLFLQFDIGMTTRKVVKAIAGLSPLNSCRPACCVSAKSGQKGQAVGRGCRRETAGLRCHHADETYYRIDGQSANVWFHGNEDLAHFQISERAAAKYRGNPRRRL